MKWPTRVSRGWVFRWAYSLLSILLVINNLFNATTLIKLPGYHPVNLHRNLVKPLIQNLRQTNRKGGQLRKGVWSLMIAVAGFKYSLETERSWPSFTLNENSPFLINYKYGMVLFYFLITQTVLTHNTKLAALRFHLQSHFL